MIGSIRGRLLLLAGLWLGAALLAAFLFISALLRDFVTDRFDAEAAALADTLIASVEAADDGGLELDDPPADPRFDLPLSGWYWQVQAGDSVIGRSSSLLDGRLSGPLAGIVGGPGVGADGARLRVLRRQVGLPVSDSPVTVTVTVPQGRIDGSLRQISRPLAMALAVLGIVLAGASLVQVTLGLESLDRLRRDLGAVRAGRKDRLTLPQANELRPLVAEINAGLDQNAELLARSRQHLGNLAHSLKTPLAALANELPPDHRGQAMLARMDRLIGWHLRRARSAGPRLLGQRIPVGPVIDDILLVLRWPMRDKGITVRIDCPPEAAFAGERQDLEEMIGNLADNAVKWGRSRLAIRVIAGPGLTIRIEDDGPGMQRADTARALIRGGRLDEDGVPGWGLGLAIVADLAALHGGSLRLERSALGGLAAVLALPA